ncbi:hypothetical protein A5701_14480 [Mycobacterium sp. E3305]|nr:hypothetical protein A5701_14480 [Mycobacterium sp. E3305]
MTVTVICDDPRHARGKVATVATITVYSDGRWQINDPHRRRILRAGRKAKRGLVHDRDALAAAAFGTETIRCKLCGRELPRYSGPALRCVVQQRVEKGEDTVHLSDLAAIISRQEER